MKIKANITISRDSDDVFRIRIEDEVSHIEFVEFQMTPHDLALSITGLAHVQGVCNVRGLEHVGKEKISECRSIVCPIEYAREEQVKWLIKNAQEEGWILDSYLGSQSSVRRNEKGETVLHYRVYKYVTPSEETK